MTDELWLVRRGYLVDDLKMKEMNLLLQGKHQFVTHVKFELSRAN